MRCYIRYIGVIDKSNHCHYVGFEEGLNIITGRSSTGKSALIEIFDYCAGSHTNTIPVGVITEHAQLYFLVLAANDTNVVIGRSATGGGTKVFYKIDFEVEISQIGADYFAEEYVIPLSSFLIELEHFCGLDITDTDETIYRTQKKGRPSFRNMVSFMLQPQHLIANKYALFYRFDEKEKQERVIDEFKIFSGIVDQRYYTLCQELEEKKKALEQCEREMTRHNEEKQRRIEELEQIRRNYSCVSGVELFPGVPSEQLISAPQQYLDQLTQYEVRVNEESDEYKRQYTQLETRKNQLLAARRKKELKLSQVNSSIEYAKRYADMMDQYSPVRDAITGDSECPFCHHKTNTTREEANRLTEAINWLNGELSKSSQRMDSFLPQKRSLQKEIEQLDSEIKAINNQMRTISKVNEQLEKNQSLENQSLKYKLQIESILEWVLDWRMQRRDDKIAQLEKDIRSINEILERTYNVEDQLAKAEAFINRAMKEIGDHFDFEASYKPIELHFDIHTFDLYHKREDGKVYLRSMGSGANWLYSHICLFLALLEYFASIEKSTVPTILFIDQPSQVYFPSIDTKSVFSPTALGTEGESAAREADEDMRAVANLYTQIAKVIESINERYGYRPQIIISDHADNLDMDGFDFNSFVRARWRREHEGLINMCDV